MNKEKNVAVGANPAGNMGRNLVAKPGFVQGPASGENEMALAILEREPQRIQKLIKNANMMREGFKRLGFKVIDGRSAVVPVIVGDDLIAFQFWRKLFDAGVFVNAFISPGVPPGLQMMRTSYMATHEEHHLQSILDVFGKIGKELGLIS